MERTPFEEWDAHLKDCQTCRRAIRGRLVGATIAWMGDKCCQVGKPLYLAFIEDIEGKES